MKTSMISRTWRGTIAIAMALTAASSIMGAVPTIAASKTGDNVDITINKKDGLDLNGLHQNTGVEMDEFKNQDPVNGAGFTVYDVTEYFYDAFDGTNGEDLYEKLKDEWSTILAGNADKIKAGKQQMTADGGQTTFKDLPIQVEYNKVLRNAVYVIAETTTVENMTPALPMVVALPVYMPGSKTEVNKNIQLYPKNYGVDKVLLDTKGDPVDEENNPLYDFEVGKVLTYRVKYVIPEDIGKLNTAETAALYSQFAVKDAMTEVGTTFRKISSVKIGDDDVMSKFGPEAAGVTLTKEESSENAAWWQMDYDMSNDSMRTRLEEEAGNTLVVEYQVVINENAVPDTKINNDFVVSFNRDGKPISQTDDGPNITTGGYKFKKVDSTTNEKLPGAKFKIQKAGTELYAKFVGTWEAPTSIEWVSKGEATEVESNSDGHIILQGLEHGNYVLVETAPPDGYVNPVNPDTTFTVKEGSYTVTELPQIKNTPNTPGKLPLTGGIGLITLVVVGGALMGASA